MSGKRILVVDDEPYILKILSFKLRLHGGIPFEATEGEGALRMIREESPDVVLLDVNLSPGLSGFDLCRILKENPLTTHLPILMLTARNLPEEREIGLALGARAYLTKPFSTKAVVDEIEAALG